jgi:hypothetical protein
MDNEVAYAFLFCRAYNPMVSVIIVCKAWLFFNLFKEYIAVRHGRFIENFL